MLDSRKYCPQCGGDQLDRRLPKDMLSWLLILLFLGFAGFLAFSLVSELKVLLTGQRPPSGSSLPMIQFLLVFLMVSVLLVPVILFDSSRRVKNPKVYLLKCQQCGHQWRMTNDEWRRAGNVSAQASLLSPQEKQQAKRTTVESLIDQIKKM
jgi:hypothetical protein